MESELAYADELKLDQTTRWMQVGGFVLMCSVGRDR